METVLFIVSTVFYLALLAFILYRQSKMKKGYADIKEQFLNMAIAQSNQATNCNVRVAQEDVKTVIVTGALRLLTHGGMLLTIEQEVLERIVKEYNEENKQQQAHGMYVVEENNVTN